MVVKTVAQAKRIRALLQNQPERQKKQEGRVDLRKKKTATMASPSLSAWIVSAH